MTTNISDQLCELPIDHQRRLTERRITLLDHLDGQDGHTSLSQLTSALVCGDESGHTKKERVEIRLHHVDLPVLDDVGLLNYDPEERVVSLRETNC